MKIDTNIVGNYSPAYAKANVAKAQAAQNSKTDSITSEEKKFFANLYPTQQDEIMNYQVYNAKGKVSGLHVGSLFDRRG